jgi:hypothetical protein
MQKNTAKQKAKCKNCEGKGLLKLGNKKEVRWDGFQVGIS